MDFSALACNWLSAVLLELQEQVEDNEGYMPSATAPSRSFLILSIMSNASADVDGGWDTRLFRIFGFSVAKMATLEQL